MKSGVAFAFALVAVLLLGTGQFSASSHLRQVRRHQAGHAERRRHARRLEKSARPHLHERARGQRRR